MRQERLSRALRTAGRALAAAIFAFGLYSCRTIDGEGWSDTGMILHALPIALVWSRRAWLRVGGLWLGVFLIAQTAISYSFPNEFKHLPPLMNKRVTVKEPGFPGIRGRQVITTDEKGFRVSRKISYSDSAPFRVFAIGASTTEELFIDDSKTWTRLLEERLRASSGKDVEVVNTGLSGLRARHHLATFRKILSYHPDLVVFLFGVNDWNHHIEVQFGSKPSDETERSKLLRFERTLLGKLIAGAKEEPTAYNANDEVEDDGSFYARMANSLERGSRHSFRPDEVLPSYAATLEELSRACKRSGVPCVFADQPSAYRRDVPEELRKRFWMTPPKTGYTLDLDSMIHVSSLYNRSLAGFARSRGHAFCELSSRLAPTYENFWDDVHFNENGARNVAELIFECLVRLILAARP